MPRFGSRPASKLKASWMVTYGDLLTGLLAFFILLIVKTEQEAETTFKFADRMKEMIYAQCVAAKEQNRLEWLHVEHTGTKGVKLLIPSEIGTQPFFESGEDRIVINFYFYLQAIANIINSLELEQIPTRYAAIIERLEEAGKQVEINVRVEGHSDIVPLGRSSRFRDNWDLSTARAHAVMDFFMRSTNLPDDYFAISGYGPFHPINDVNNYSENRRVEIYIDIQLVDVLEFADG